jgi:hypothetical protein
MPSVRGDVADPSARDQIAHLHKCGARPRPFCGDFPITDRRAHPQIQGTRHRIVLPYLLTDRTQIWPNLGLAVLFKSCDHVREGNESHNIRLSFWMRKMPGQSMSSKPSRLPGSLQEPHDAVPPSGIPTGCLSSVIVCLEYRLKQCIGSYTETPLYSTPTVIGDDNSQDDTFAESLLSETLYFPPEKPASIGKNTATAFARELQASSEDWTIPLHDDSLQWTNDNGHTQQFNELLDIGLRNLITCKPAGTWSTIREDIPTHLAELAPAVFSRGYSEVSHRHHTEGV